MKIIALIAALLMLPIAQAAQTNSTSACIDGRTLQLNTSINITVNNNNTGIVMSEPVRCQNGCDAVTNKCNPRTMFSIEGFVILFGLTIILILIGYHFDLWIFGLAGGVLLFFNGIMAWQGIEISGFEYTAVNNIFIPAFAVTLMAMSVYIIYTSALGAWENKRMSGGG